MYTSRNNFSYSMFCRDWTIKNLIKMLKYDKQNRQVFVEKGMVFLECMHRMFPYFLISDLASKNGSNQKNEGSSL